MSESTQLIVYMVNGKEFGMKSQAIAELEMLMGYKIESVDWLEASTRDDYAHGRKVYINGMHTRQSDDQP
jgi:hypothetical protein